MFVFYYLMNLHYSQTLFQQVSFSAYVLLPYEFTLLSNIRLVLKVHIAVLLPYEFTLLSNIYVSEWTVVTVLLPYEFTLLSNHRFAVK